jgi:thermolysin
MRKILVFATLLGAVVLAREPRTQAQGIERRLLDATTVASLRQSDGLVTALSRAGQLREVQRVADTLVSGREHERYQQVVNGVPVWASTITRQQAAGVPISIFGELYDGLDAVATQPTLTGADARAIAAADAGVELGPVDTPLYVLVTAAGPRLVYAPRVASPRIGIQRYFVDAVTGDIVERRNELKRDVGTGRGVFGSDKKISTTPGLFGLFVALDSLRPPLLATYDLRGNAQAVFDFLDGRRRLSTIDLASDADNRWTDGPAVDAHVYSGWTYDYYFKRFGRMGLDDRNLPIINIVHPVNRTDTQLLSMFPDLFVNAFYAGDGVMVYGEGLPPALSPGGPTIDYFAAALDIVAHELTHGVTDYTSALEYHGESGALNESFSDIMGTSVEFMFQPLGTGRGQADWLVGEDVFLPAGIRSLSNPATYGDPDHYSQRYTGTEDDGGVHINSAIPNQAFYLAVAGGTNRTSGRTVTGVGFANREQVEQVFYRAFTAMLPATARFATARAATIQAARDLYGAGSAVERAVTDAWTAVGVL